MQAPDSVHGDKSTEFLPVVLIGGSIRSAAQSARRAGFPVFGIDLFGDRDARQACDGFQTVVDWKSDPRILVHWCNKFTVKPHLIWAGGLQDDAPQRMHDLDAQGVLEIAPSYEFDHALLLQIATGAGIRVPKVSRKRTDVSLDCLIKRDPSCGGLGVTWATDAEIVDGRLVFQEWISGRSFGATFISNGQQCELLAVCRSLFTRIGSRPFVYSGSVGPVRVPNGVRARLSHLGACAVAATGVAGLFNADVIVDEAGEIWLLEINARWSGSSEVVELAMCGAETERSRSLFANHWLAQNGQPFPKSQLNQACHIKRIVFSKSAGILNPDRLLAMGAEKPAGVELKDIPAESSRLGRGEPIATLIMKLGPAWSPTKYKRLLARMQEAVE